MEKTISDFSFELFFWQLLGLIVVIVIIYFLIKLYKKIIKYVDKN